MMPRLVLAFFILLSGTLTVLAQSNPSPIANQSSAKRSYADPDELLIKAIKSGDLGAALQQLDGGASPDATDDHSPVLFFGRENESRRSGRGPARSRRKG